MTRTPSSRLHFRSLRTRVSMLYAGLFAATLLIVAAIAQTLLVANVERTVARELATSGAVFDRILALRGEAQAGAASMLARDYGFREAVATGDVATIESALVNLRGRMGADNAFIVTRDGVVTGSGAPSLRAAAATVPARMQGGRTMAVAWVDTAAHQFQVAPILAPDLVGWVVFATALNAKEMQALEAMSAIPLDADVLERKGNAWTHGGLTLPGSDVTELDQRGGRALALVKPLPAPDGAPETALLLSYPFAKAMAPYRSLQAGILVVGVIGLLAMLIGSLRLAKTITRPIAALDEAARALKNGERTEVAVIGEDEIGRLAQSFNAMSRGIIERENRIAHLAFHDSLTGLPNRALFREQLETDLKRAAHRGAMLAVLCLDLDGFKSVNDTLGHPVGDEMLKVVGEIVTRCVGPAHVARLGGDEFAIIVSDYTDMDRPRALAQAIVDRLREPMVVAGHQVASGGSIGIAVGPADGDDADTLLKNADLALYRAKQDGRGGFRFFEPALDAAARARRQMELDMREALAKGHFHLDFQPVLSLKSDRIVGFEALLRWRHPRRGAIAPVDFIPVAEDTGMIVQIGEWVIHEACRQARGWPEHLRVAVNVSPLQFRSPGFQSIVVQALARTGLAPERLEIELTESIFLESSSDTLSLLHSLRTLGIRFALDDFGTGYSSLSYLRAFPFDKIKIDRSFVTGVAAESNAAAIVRAIVDLATALGMETTAEGVEDEDQMDALRAQGCGSMQGYLYSRPIHADDVAGLVSGQDPVAEAA